MHNYRKLKVWQLGVEIVVDVYVLTSSFPEKERFNLISQINGAAVSVPSNIAEGSGRGTVKDFLHFLNISRGSSYELETQLIISEKLGYLSQDELSNILLKTDSLQRMITRLQQKLRNQF